MDWDLVIKVLLGLNTIGLSVISFVMWVRKPGQDSGEAVTLLGERVSRIEETLKHMPTNEELARLDGSTREAAARMEAVQMQLNTLSNQLNLIQRHLMDQK